MAAATARQRSLMFGLVMVITLAAFEALATTTVMPAVKEDLGGVALYGWAFSAFLLASLVGITFAGEQADRHGPARPFVVGVVLFAAGLTIAGCAPAMWVVVLGRAVQGLGAGVIPPIAYVAVGRGFPEDMRPRILAWFATAWVVPGLVGPGLAGAVAEYATWRLVFLGLLPLVALSFVLVVPSLRALGAPEGDAPAGRLTRTPSALLLAGGAAVLLAGISSPSPLLALPLVAVGLVTAFPATRRLLPAGTFRAAPGLPAMVLGLGALVLAFFGADAFVPFMLTEVRGQSTVFAGAVITGSTLSWTAGTWIVDRNRDRWSRPALVGAGLALVGFGTLGHLLVLIDSVPVAFALVTWSVAALGMGLAYPTFSLMVLSAATPGTEGVATSSAKLSESLCAAMGTGVVGAIVAAGDSGGWLSASLAVSFVLMATVAFAALLLTTRLPVATRTGAPPALAAAEA